MDIEGGFRRKLGTACLSCKRRKVRCDIAGRGPCTPCSKNNTPWCGQREQTHRPSSAQQARRARVQRPAETRLRTPAIVSADRQDTALPSSPAPIRSEALTTFYERGIGTRDWGVFCDSLPIRIVYVGNSTANLHQLVLTEDPGNPLHYPFPSIKPLLPWRPDAEQLNGSYLTSHVARDLSCLPARDVRDALVQTYFDDIHPGFPIIDEEEFRRQYREESELPPLLLLHTVLLAAARISDHPRVASARSNVTATLFRRAKTLFDLRYENDRVHLVQAALLLAWHVENSDTISGNAYHWVGQATRIALGLGMHRDLLKSPYSIMPVEDRRVYRKCWWTILQSEAFVALEYGRPPMIRSDDYDQPALGEADFLNFDGSQDTLVEQNFVSLNSSLGEIALHISSVNTPLQRSFDVTAVDNSLAAWASNLPVSHNFWSCLLRINYSLTKLVFHRPGRTDASPVICAEAASTILTTFETMSASGMIRKCSFFASNALLAAAIQFSREIRDAVTCRGSPIKALSAHAQLERLLRPMQALSAYWPNIEALHRLCVSLHNKCSERITTMNSQASLPTDDATFQAHIDWADIMAGYELPHTNSIFDIADWMNTA